MVNGEISIYTSLIFYFCLNYIGDNMFDLFMYEWFLLILSLIVLGISCYTDVRTREIPDWASWGLVVGALGIRFIASFFVGWDVLLEGVLGFFAMGLLGLLMYYTHQWGGGDAKLLFGFGIVVGVSYPFSLASILILLFVFALFIGGAIWGLVWMGYEASVHRGFRRAFVNRVFEFRRIVLLIMGISLVGMILFGLLGWYYLLPFVIFVPLMMLLFFFVKTVETECFIREIPVKDVTEGDWLCEPIRIGSVVVDSRTLSLDDLETIRKLYREGKVTKVKVKYGVPFAPAFVIAYGVVLWLKYH